MANLETLKALADDRDFKRYLFLLAWRDLLLWHMNYLLCQSIPDIDYGLSPWGEVVARLTAKFFYNLPSSIKVEAESIEEFLKRVDLKWLEKNSIAWRLK